MRPIIFACACVDVGRACAASRLFVGVGFENLMSVHGCVAFSLLRLYIMALKVFLSSLVEQGELVRLEQVPP